MEPPRTHQRSNIDLSLGTMRYSLYVRYADPTHRLDFTAWQSRSPAWLLLTSRTYGRHRGTQTARQKEKIEYIESEA